MEMKGMQKQGYFLMQPGTSFNSKNLLEIRERIEKAWMEGNRSFGFDLSHCKSMDSSGIGLIVHLHKKCIAKGGKIGILNPSKEMLTIFSVSNLGNILNIYKSPEEMEKGL